MNGSSLEGRMIGNLRRTSSYCISPSDQSLSSIAPRRRSNWIRQDRSFAQCSYHTKCTGNHYKPQGTHRLLESTERQRFLHLPKKLNGVIVFTGPMEDIVICDDVKMLFDTAGAKPSLAPKDGR